MGLGLKTPVVTVKAETNNDSFKDSGAKNFTVVLVIFWKKKVMRKIIVMDC